MKEEQATETITKSFDTLERLDARKPYVAPDEDALETWDANKPKSRTAQSPIDPKIKAYIREQIGSLIATIAESVCHERARNQRQFETLRQEIKALAVRGPDTHSKIGRVRFKDKE